MSYKYDEVHSTVKQASPRNVMQLLYTYQRRDQLGYAYSCSSTEASRHQILLWVELLRVYGGFQEFGFWRLP